MKIHLLLGVLVGMVTALPMAQAEIDWRRPSIHDNQMAADFEAVDQNEDGYLDVGELARFLPHMNWPVAQAKLGDARQNLSEAAKIIGRLDSNTDGKLSFREYRKMSVQAHYSNDIYQTYKNEPGMRLFAIHDKNIDGYLDINEYLTLRGFPKPYTNALRQQEYQRIQKYDTNGDGLISLQEYRYNFMTRVAR